MRKMSIILVLCFLVSAVSCDRMTEKPVDLGLEAAVTLVKLAVLFGSDVQKPRSEQAFKYHNITVYSQGGIVTRVEPAGAALAEPLRVTETEIERALGIPLARVAVTSTDVRLVYSNISLWLNKANLTCYKITTIN